MVCTFFFQYDGRQIRGEITIFTFGTGPQKIVDLGKSNVSNSSICFKIRPFLGRGFNYFKSSSETVEVVFQVV